MYEKSLRQWTKIRIRLCEPELPEGAYNAIAIIKAGTSLVC
jgi:hypothetical protein